MIRSLMSNQKVTYPFDQAVTEGHMTKGLHYKFNPRPDTTKPDMVMAYEINTYIQGIFLKGNDTFQFHIQCL